ncbi:MAG: hypothetical protein LQ342_003835 [Letrouitia transgressa]|nr:MAG: hypothetical protein LQ342_003835 [Letrouitia transgressa]
MSFDRSPVLESQPTTMRREDDPEYQDDPDFSRFAEEISVKLFQLTSNIARLSQQINLLGTKRETDRVRERVNDLLEEARSGFKEVGEAVKRLTTWEDLNKELQPSQKYTQQKLSREFQASGTEFQSIQRTALEKQRASASAARSAADAGERSGLSPYSDNEPQQQQQQQIQEQEQLRLASQDEVDFQESMIIERESEIRNIEQSVGELNELFRDVAHIVREQGEELNTIDANVQNVRGDTQQADIELRSASRYQKASRNKACCLLLILAVVLIIIILAAVLG